MRTLWNAVAVLAIINLLALAIVGGWLWRSGRVDRDRIEAVRTLFSLSIAEEEERRRAEEAALLAADAEENVPLAWQPVPVTNLDVADARERLQDLAAVTNARLAADAGILVDRIEDAYRRRDAELTERETALQRERDRLAEIRSRTRDDDFKRVVADLGEMKLDASYGILGVWLAEGRRTLVVDVLHALEAERRHDVLAEFVDAGRAEVAADLQLALRERTALQAALTEDLDADSTDSDASTRSGTADAAVDA